MRRILTACFIAALCVALIGCAALADEADDLLYIDGAMDGLVLSGDAAIAGDDLELNLDVGALELSGPESAELSEPLQNDEDDGSSAVSNKTVFKDLIRYRIEDGNATIISADKAICEAYIPEKVKGYKVVSIEDGAFAGCKDLWTVTVPDTVTEIGEDAFANCGKLAFVTLPTSLERIGNYAFKNCPLIAHFDLPEGLTEISEGLFENCTEMWKITIPSTVRKIGDGAFFNCTKLKQFTLPDGLEEIGKSAFELCQDMKTVSIPAGIEAIPEFAFKDCTELNIVELKDGLKSIGFSAFRNCVSMRSVKLPSSVEFIDRFAFAYCEEMTSLKIPGNVRTLGYGAFFHCVDAEEICLMPGVVEVGDYCFAQCKSLVKVDIAESVEAIGENVFTVGRSSRINENGAVQQGEPLSLPDKMKIYGRPDTAAQAYAKANGIPFAIKKILATDLSIAEGKSATLYMGQTLQLTAVQTPANAETKVKWKSSSSSVSVSGTGLLKPKRSGKATITACTENNKKATIAVKVIDAQSVSIVEGKELTMKVGEELQLNAEITPEQVSSRLTWSSDSKKIATVSSTGLVKAKNKGTVSITVKTANGKKAKIKVKVTA